jgi:hypothetical protein
VSHCATESGQLAAPDGGLSAHVGILGAEEGHISAQLTVLVPEEGNLGSLVTHFLVATSCSDVETAHVEHQALQ